MSKKIFLGIAICLSATLASSIAPKMSTFFEKNIISANSVKKAQTTSDVLFSGIFTCVTNNTYSLPVASSSAWYGEVLSACKVYWSPFTNKSDLLLVKVITSFIPTNGQLLRGGNVSIQPFLYVDSSSGENYHGGHPYFIDYWPKETSSTSIVTTSISTSVSVTDKTTQSASISLDGLATLGFSRSITGSITSTYTLTTSIQNAEPKLSSCLVNPTSLVNNTGAKWFLSYQSPISAPYTFEHYYLYEIGKDTSGVYQNAFSLNVQGETDTIDNTWWFPNRYAENMSHYWLSTFVYTTQS